MDEILMAWYADLEPCDYFGAVFASRLRAVGWLERRYLFSTGEVSEAFFAKLCQLLLDPWHPAYPLGGQPCDLCRFTGGGETVYRGLPVRAYSSGCLFVPGSDVVYVSPISLAHSIDAHGYQPPEAFCAAVLACPEMRSVAYLRALLANGGKGLAQAAEW